MEHEANEATVAISMPETGEEASLEATRIESSMEMSEGMQTPAAAPNLVIDKPAAPPMMARKTELDSYKVEVRRPGKRT